MMGSDLENQVEQEEAPAPAPEPAPAPAPEPAPTYAPAPQPMAPPPMAAPMKPHTWKGTIAGVLLILSGLFGIFSGIVIAFWWETYTGFMPMDIPMMDTFESILMVCGIIFIVLSLIILLSGFMALKRKSWGMAIVGSIFAILFGGVLFGIIALILLVLAKDEF